MGMNEKKITQAVILAGGRGIRMMPYTADRPKPMVLVNGRPFLEHLIDFLKEQGIQDIVLLLGYLPEKVTEHFGDGSKFGVRIKYSIGGVDDLTGTRVRNAKELLGENFLLLYCDNYIPVNLAKLAAFHEKHHVPATVTVYTNKDGRTKNNMFVDPDGYVAKYDKSRTAPGLNGVDLGFFVVNKRIVDSMPSRNFWFEEETMPSLIAARQLAGFEIDHPYYSLSNPERMVVLEKFLAPKKVIFVERDAVIGGKTGAQADAQMVSALQSLNERGYHIYIVANAESSDPEVVAGGNALRRYETKPVETMLASHGISVSGIYGCPHVADAACECRMPNPGLFVEAARDHCLDLTKALFWAGTETGARAGATAGIPTVLMKAGENPIDAISSNLLHA